MKLLVPIKYNGKVYTNYELGRLKGGVVADATEELQSGGDFSAMHTLVSGCLKSLSTDSGEEITSGFDSVVRHAPIQAIEILSLELLTKDKNPGIEQISICPRCKDRVIYEDDKDGSHKALYFDDLEILPLTGDQSISIDLEEEVNIRKKDGEILKSISSITLRYPTINDGIKGSSKVSETKGTRRQYAIYAEALTHINGEDASSDKKVWGTFILERMCFSDLEKISTALRNVGIKKTVNRECLKCGKKWESPIDLSGFFESGLQL